MSANNGNNEGPGKRPMGLVGIVGTSLYLVLIGGVLLISIVQIWPPSCKKEIPVSTPAPSQSASPAASATTEIVLDPCKCEEDKTNPAPVRHQARILWWRGCLYDEDRLLLIVILAGALGSLVHGLRSLYWYIGNREMVRSWMAMYLMLPFVGATMGVVFYFIVRGGFFTPSASIDTANPFGFAAIAALIGMFTEQAALKLQQVATTVLAEREKGKDHAELAPAVKQVEPPTGSTSGGTSVKITGERFTSGATVSFGGVAATSVSVVDDTRITAVTPPHPAGAVDVVVTDANKLSGTLPKGFTYIDDPKGGSGNGNPATGDAAAGSTAASTTGTAGAEDATATTTSNAASDAGTTGTDETSSAGTTTGTGGTTAETTS